MTRAYDHKELHGGASFPMIGEGLFLYTTTDGEVIGVSLPSLSFSRFTQPIPSSRWHFTHDLGYLPLVQVYDETGHIITESVHVSVTNTTVTVETENGVLVGGYLTLMGASGSSGDGAEYVKLSDLGNYALVSALNAAVSTLQTEIDGKQSAGNYVLQQAFTSAISSLQTAVDGKQSAGEYARLVQGVIPTSQLPNDWLINTTTVGSDTEMLALTQFRRGDFVWRSDQNAYYDLMGNDPTVIGNWQRRIHVALRSVNGQAGPDVVLGHGDVGAAPAGDYALNSALANYVLTAAFNQSVASLQAAINGKQNAGDYALNSALANYVLTTTFNQSVATLQAGINTKQPTGNYTLKSSIRATLSIDSASVIIPSTSNVIPFTMTDNFTLTNNIQTGTEDGQLLTLVNLSSKWLILPVFGGRRIIFAGDNLNLVYSTALQGWVAQGFFKGFTCRAHASGNITIPLGASTTTTIPLDGTRYDTAGGLMHSNTDNNSRIIAPISGYYRAWVGLQVNNSGTFAIFFLIPGGGITAAHSLVNGGFASIASGTYFLSAGHYVELGGRAYTAAATLVRTPGFANEAELTLESL